MEVASLVFTSVTEIFSKTVLSKMLRLLPKHYQQSGCVWCMNSRHFIESQHAAAVVWNAAFSSNDLIERLVMQHLKLSSASWADNILSLTVTSSFWSRLLPDRKPDSGLQLPEQTHHPTNTFCEHYTNKTDFFTRIPNLLKQVDFVLNCTARQIKKFRPRKRVNFFLTFKQ